MDYTVALEVPVAQRDAALGDLITIVTDEGLVVSQVGDDEPVVLRERELLGVHYGKVQS